MKIVEPDVVECVGEFEDEYVYDIELEDGTSHTFFANDILVHNSAYIQIDDVLTKLNIPLMDDNDEVTDKAMKVCKFIESGVNKGIKQWGENELFSIDCKFEFKMEAVCDYVLLIKSKHYVMHVVNEEGFDIKNEDDRWKYKGIALVSAGMPKALKPTVEKILHTLVLTSDINKTNDIYFNSFEEFKKLPIDDIAAIRSCNKYSEYAAKSKGFATAKGMSAHYRGAYYYNMLLDELKIGGKYERIKDFDKIKYLYLVPNNKYNINVISYLDYYPKEFEKLFEVDKSMMFEKMIKDLVKQFYDAVGWRVQSPNKQTMVNVLEEFLN